MSKVEWIVPVINGRIPLHIMQEITRAIAKADGKRLAITIKEVKRNRSLRQNRYYWGVVIRAIVALFEQNGTTIDDEGVHDYLRVNVGGLKTVITDPAGVKRTAMKSTTMLTTIEFENYMEKVRAWAAQFGLIIPLPHEDGNYE